MGEEKRFLLCACAINSAPLIAHRIFGINNQLLRQVSRLIRVVAENSVLSRLDYHAANSSRPSKSEYTSLTSSATAHHVYFPEASLDACRPSLRLKLKSDLSSSTELTICPEFPGAIRSPFCPSSTTSIIPQVAVVMTGMPLHIASIKARGVPSKKLGRRKTS